MVVRVDCNFKAIELPFNGSALLGVVTISDLFVVYNSPVGLVGLYNNQEINIQQSKQPENKIQVRTTGHIQQRRLSVATDHVQSSLRRTR
jgi:hypothetical protein